MSAKFGLIGVDGGATEVKAHEVRCADLRTLSGFELGTASVSRVYERLPDFAALPVGEQIAERDAGRIQLSAGEAWQGALWVEAAADAVAEVAQAMGGAARPVLVGMGMPGLKRPDRRGIVVINNGPRVPDYLAALERSLASRGVRLAAPIAELGSDADYCGLGEEYAAEGLLRGVQNAYYVGCGTGVADAMKLCGRLVTFEESRGWILKSWQVPSALGPTFEKLVSAKSVNAGFEALGGRIADGRFPEVCAAEGDRIAYAWLMTVALVLAELLFERVSTLFRGRGEAPHRGPGYQALVREHPFVGTVLDRIVIGQRLGQIYATGLPSFADRVIDGLEAFLEGSDDLGLQQAYLGDEGLHDGLIVPSTLRAAPAIGAAVAAARAHAAPA